MSEKKNRKVPFFTKSLLFKSAEITIAIVGLTSTIQSFIDIVWWGRLIILFASFVIMIPIHIALWNISNKLKNIRLVINNSDLYIEEGDIFKEDGNKVIAFNEYFDTSFENGLISEGSLNGKYLKTLNNTETLDTEIEAISEEKVVETNESRELGKKRKFKLGTIHKRMKYYLLAFSHFDKDNRAWLTTNDYVACLLNMWEEIDKIYNGESVCIPLLGSGITRMKDNYDISDQELLETMIWTLKISKVKFTYPSNVKIVVYKDKIDKINLYKIKEEQK